MNGFCGNIEKETLSNSNFRRVVYTAKNSQLVVMCLKPEEEIGMEVHPHNDQFLRFEKGEGVCIINGHKHEASEGFAIIVPAGAKHNIVNRSKRRELKLYTVYSPPHHKDGTVHKTKQHSDMDKEEFDGNTTE